MHMYSYCDKPICSTTQPISHVIKIIKVNVVQVVMQVFIQTCLLWSIKLNYHTVGFQTWFLEIAFVCKVCVCVCVCVCVRVCAYVRMCIRAQTNLAEFECSFERMNIGM